MIAKLVGPLDTPATESDQNLFGTEFEFEHDGIPHAFVIDAAVAHKKFLCTLDEVKEDDDDDDEKFEKEQVTSSGKKDKSGKGSGSKSGDKKDCGKGSGSKSAGKR